MATIRLAAWFPLVPSEGLRRSPAANPMSPPNRPPLVESLALRVLCEAAYRARWVTRLRPGVVVSDSPSRSSYRLRLSAAFASDSSSRALPFSFRVSRATTGPGAVSGAPFPGLPTLIAASVCGVHLPRASQARYVPSATFLTSPTVSSSADLAGLFHPATTSRVRSSGVSPVEKPYGLVARRCPLVVHALALLSV